MKHFTIIETEYDTESPMIGTIDNIIPNKAGYEYFRDRLKICIKEHFDTTKVTFIDDLEEIFNLLMACPGSWEDVNIGLDTNETYVIRIMETWIY